MTYLIGQGIRDAMQANNDEPRSDEMYWGKRDDGTAQYSTAEGRDYSYRYTVEDGVKYRPFSQAPAAATWPPARTGTVVRGIDTSSHDGMGIGAKIKKFQAKHVMIHAYTSFEAPGLEQYTIQQDIVARALGCTTGPYMWFFGNQGADGARKQVQSCLDLCDRTGMKNPILSFDLETYRDQHTFDPGPINPDTLDAGLDECDRFSVPVVFYTGFWWVRDWFAKELYPVSSQLRIAEFGRRYSKRVALWLASYDGVPDLDVWQPFGGFSVLHGKQYRVDSTGGVQTDLDVFDTSITRRAA